MNILGISAFYHDSAAALLREGQLVAAAHEERFTRKRHDPSLPVQAVHYCLEAAGIGVGENAAEPFPAKSDGFAGRE